MKKFTVALLGFVIVFTCMVAHAETDYRAMKIINEWKVGENNANTPTGFRVNGDLTVTGDTATTGDAAFTATVTAEDFVAGDTVTVGDSVTVGDNENEVMQAIGANTMVGVGYCYATSVVEFSEGFSTTPFVTLSWYKGDPTVETTGAAVNVWVATVTTNGFTIGCTEASVLTNRITWQAIGGGW